MFTGSRKSQMRTHENAWSRIVGLLALSVLLWPCCQKLSTGDRYVAVSGTIVDAVTKAPLDFAWFAIHDSLRRA